MKILFLTTSSGLYGLHNEAYHGIGWVAGLQRVLEEQSDLELAVAFPTDVPRSKVQQGVTTYYPLYRKPLCGIRKLWYYWQGYGAAVADRSIVALVQAVVDDFRPDLIHIFGTEADFGYVVDQFDVPCVIHIQGLLSEILPRYFPKAIQAHDFKRSNLWRECVLRNGVTFNYRLMQLAAQRETCVLRRARYVIGRTEWDCEVVKAINPKLHYYHVDEVLRAPFYQAPKWRLPATDELVIVSTLSDVAYKGLDLVLQTAQLLQQSGVQFRWHIVGLNESALTARCYGERFGGNSLPMVRYEGVKRADEVIDLLLQASLYVHPSQIDNSPNSLCEAQYLGLPVLATDVGGIPTLMEHQTARMVPFDSPTMLAEKIQEVWLLLQQQGEDQVCYHAENRHDPQRIASMQMAVYRAILEQAKNK